MLGPPALVPEVLCGLGVRQESPGAWSPPSAPGLLAMPGAQLSVPHGTAREQLAGGFPWGGALGAGVSVPPFPCHSSLEATSSPHRLPEQSWPRNSGEILTSRWPCPLSGE